ncbi:hypothetical protein KRR26_17800 [Corallococcus sp. M34]|uniref:UPF0231 family protein n=1 Tax=Citreicoccus inhibens TaxID=2849499 RepID=UPI0011C3D29D|nr:UPF0231 family protein [Citreicoccus inhibens]MBU8897475.1 hypothetical protein [Citreicoccus inhibens]
MSAPPPDDVLADYLTQELRPDVSAAQRLLRVTRAVRDGQRERWAVPGEGWSLDLSRARATIHCETTIPGRVLHLPLEEFEEVVVAWLQFLELSLAH